MYRIGYGSCDLCSKWYHYACVNVESVSEEQDWVCPKCIHDVNENVSLPRVSEQQQDVYTSNSAVASSHVVVSVSQPVTSQDRTRSSSPVSVRTTATSNCQGFYTPNRFGTFGLDVGQQDLQNILGLAPRYVQSYSCPRMAPRTLNLDLNRNAFGQIGFQPSLNFQRFQVNAGTPHPYRQSFIGQPVSNQMIQLNQFQLVDSSRTQNPATSQQQASTMNYESNEIVNNACSINPSEASHRMASIQQNDLVSRASSRRSLFSSRRQEIELAMLEEERELQRKRDNEYLNRKYRILLNQSDESVVTKVTDRSRFTEDWIKNIPQPEREPRNLETEPEVGRLEKRIGKISLKDTSPMKAGLFGEDRDLGSNVSDWNTKPNEGVLNEQRSRIVTSRNEKDNFVSSQHVGAMVCPETLSKTQIAARHVVAKSLPTFNGRPEDWPMFISRFNNSTETCGFSNQENLDRLQNCLRGSALEAVRSRLLSADSVPDIIEVLRMLYGRPELIIGSDNVSLIAQLEIVEGEFNQPIATKTRLGWSIHGDTSNCKRSEARVLNVVSGSNHQVQRVCLQKADKTILWRSAAGVASWTFEMVRMVCLWIQWTSKRGGVLRMPTLLSYMIVTRQKDCLMNWMNWTSVQFPTMDPSGIDKNKRCV